MYAKPRDRAILTVGLNPGPAKSELANVTPGEIVWRKNNTFFVPDRHQTG
jgi:hypothetical protein